MTSAGHEFKVSTQHLNRRGYELLFKQLALDHLKRPLCKSPNGDTIAQGNCIDQERRHAERHVANGRNQIRRWPSRTIKSAIAGGPVSVQTLPSDVLQTKCTDSNRLNASIDRFRSGTSIASIDIRLGPPNSMGVQQQDFKVHWLPPSLTGIESPLQQSLVSLESQQHECNSAFAPVS